MKSELDQRGHQGQRGMFSLKTKEGILDLHAPPSSLQGVKRGDQVAVEIAIKPMK